MQVATPLLDADKRVTSPQVEGAELNVTQRLIAQTHAFGIVLNEPRQTQDGVTQLHHNVRHRR